MHRLLDQCMRRKGRFLMLLVAFALSGLLGYRLALALPTTQCEVDSPSAASEIEVPHTGSNQSSQVATNSTGSPNGSNNGDKTPVADPIKHPEESLTSAYSSGSQAAVQGAGNQQLTTFPFDFRHEANAPAPSDQLTPADDPSEGPNARQLAKAVATGVFVCSVLALGLRVVSDRYLR